jgi:hypothetical protein
MNTEQMAIALRDMAQRLDTLAPLLLRHELTSPAWVEVVDAKAAISQAAERLERAEKAKKKPGQR